MNTLAQAQIITLAHLDAAAGWDDAIEMLRWAFVNQASVTEMQEFRRVSHKIRPPESESTDLPAGDEADAASDDDAAVLRRRLIDMAHGANMGFSIAHLEGSSADEYTMCDSMGLEAFAKWVRCVEMQLVPDDLDLTRLSDLHHFETLDGAVQWLLQNGVRG